MGTKPKIEVAPDTKDYVSVLSEREIRKVLSLFKHKFLKGLSRVEIKEPSYRGEPSHYKRGEKKSWIELRQVPREEYNPSFHDVTKLGALAHEIGHHIFRFQEVREEIEECAEQFFPWTVGHEDFADMIKIAVLKELDLGQRELKPVLRRTHNDVLEAYRNCKERVQDLIFK